MDDAVLAMAGSVALGAFVVAAPALEVLPRRGRRRLASLGGGAGLAYVFLYLLFELATEGASKIHRVLPLGPAPLETLFLLLLIAFAGTYLLQVRFEATADPRDDHRGHAALFAAYNLLAGAGLVEEARWGTVNLAFYVTAIGLHLLFNDRFMGHASGGLHNWGWRGALAVAPVAGAGAAVLVPPPDGALYAVLAFVAGGTIINVLRHELPTVAEFNATFFTIGVVGYAALILGTWRF